MAHVSIEGPAQLPYVNVAFQLEEAEIRAKDCCWLANMNTFSFFMQRTKGLRIKTTEDGVCCYISLKLKWYI